MIPGGVLKASTAGLIHLAMSIFAISCSRCVFQHRSLLNLVVSKKNSFLICFTLDFKAESDLFQYCAIEIITCQTFTGSILNGVAQMDVKKKASHIQALCDLHIYQAILI